jgi:integrase
MTGLYRMHGSRFYWYRWTGPDGQRRAVSLKTDDEAEAIRRARSVSHESFTNPMSPLIPLLDRYLNEARNRNKKPIRAETARVHRYILAKFISVQKLSQLSDLTSKQLDEFVRQYSGETASTYAAVTLTFGRWLHKKGLVAYYPFEGFERPTRPAKGRTTWVGKDAVQELIDTAPDDDMKFILYCGFHAGMRRGEISWAAVDWFDLENNLVHVVSDPERAILLKDENRVVPLTNQFAEFLKTYLVGKTGFVLAPDKAKGKWKYRYDFRNPFNRHVAGKCSIHDMRRSFASNRASAGVSIYKIAQWLGDGVQVVERSYGHLAPADQDVNLGV